MKRVLCFCCTAHFLVDFACAFLLFRCLWGHPGWAELLILYNFCAFAVQMPLGLLADRWNLDGLVAGVGAALVAAAYGLVGLPWLAVTVVGLGNAAFHVGAGLEVLSLSENRAGPLGLFVSPGAVGLFCGTLLGKGGMVPVLAPPVVLLAAALALFRFRAERPDGHRTVSFPHFQEVWRPILLLLAVVVLRSHVGMALTFPWKGERHWGLVLVLALALGKVAGGYLADCFGFQRTAVGSLLLAAGLLLASNLPICGAAAVFLFNMTMPLTLWACARLLPGSRGFAFGILTFGLFLGFLPTALGASGLTGLSAAPLALVSLVLLLPALRKAVKP